MTVLASVIRQEKYRPKDWKGAIKSSLTVEGNLYIVVAQFLVTSYSLQPHGLQNTRLPCPSPSPRACSKSCPLSWVFHPIISSSVTPFSSCLQSFPASGSFLISRLFTSGGQSIGASVSTSVLPMNIQG